MNFLNVIIYISATIELIIGGVVFFNDKKNQVNQLFTIVSIITAYWIITNSIITLEPNEFWVKNAYATGILLAPAILIWIKKFINEKMFDAFLLTVILCSSLILYFISLFSDLIIQDVSKSFTGGFIGTFGPIFPIYALHFIIISIYILYLITNAFNKSTGVEKIQYGYIAFGLYGFGLIVTIVNFILPLFGVTHLTLLDSPSSIIFIASISFVILKHHLFNIKVIATELVTFSLWIFILIRAILAETSIDFAIEGGLFLISVLLGVILIRSVLSETKQRERIEQLAGDVKVAYEKVNATNHNLEAKIFEQTADVRRAYEIEREARTKLEELNETKDRFITSTQHHLRTPMTSLKWELESIRKGTYGSIGPELKSALDNADASVKNMDNIVEDFIKITEKNS